MGRVLVAEVGRLQKARVSNLEVAERAVSRCERLFLEVQQAEQERDDCQREYEQRLQKIEEERDALRLEVDSIPARIEKAVEEWKQRAEKAEADLAAPVVASGLVFKRGETLTASGMAALVAMQKERDELRGKIDEASASNDRWKARATAAEQKLARAMEAVGRYKTARSISLAPNALREDGYYLTGDAIEAADAIVAALKESP